MLDDYSPRDVAERLTALIEALPDAISFKDSEGRWIVANSATLRLFDLVDRPWQGKTDLELADLYPEFSETFTTCHTDDLMAWEFGSRFDTIEHVPSPDGDEPLTFFVTKVPLFHENNTPDGLVIIARDITERMRIEKQLAESELKLRTIIETEPECVKLVAKDGTLLQINQAGLRMLGAQTASEVIGRPVYPFVTPDYRKDFEALTDSVFSGESKHLEFEIINLCGIHYWLESNAVPLRDIDENIVAMLSVTRDITARKKVELALAASEERFRNIMDSNPVGMAIVSLDGKYLRVNQALCNITGYTQRELEQMSISDITPPEDVESQDHVRQSLINGRTDSYRMEKRHIHKDGHTLWIQVTASVVRDEQEQPLYFVGQVEDITAQKVATNALRESEKKFRDMFELSPVGMALNDLATGTFIEANPALLASVGYSEDELYRLSYWEVTPPEYEPQEETQLASLMMHGHYGPFEKEYIRKDGQRFPVLLKGVRLQDSTGRDLILSIVQDISERKAAEAEIHQLAFFDSLTNLANRRLLLDRVRKALHSSARRDCYGAIFFIDLDNFKLLNDTMGHDIGDLLLKEIARRLSATVRADDTVARLGGDEFVVVLENLSEEESVAAAQAMHVGEKLRIALNAPVSFYDYTHYATSSIGISLFKGTRKTVDDLLKHADVALYGAKNAGRNRVCFYDPSMQEAIDERVALESELRTALQEKQFALFYQLQVNRDNKATCAEALLRWNSPKRGMVMPNDFIPLAEETGLIVPIGYWVLETACNKLKKWETNPFTRDICLSVNVSSRQFHQAGFVEEVRGLIERIGILPGQLKLELTESTILKDVNDTIKKMCALKALGIGLAMDDFGTGFSSLSYLVNMPFEQLKIGRSFIHDIEDTHANIAVVDTIMYLAKNLGLEVIAEGVETKAQHDLLSKMGCPSFQGYLFAHPLPDTEFEKLVTSTGHP